MAENTERIFAQIEYHGLPGVTQECLGAIVRLLHFGDKINKACLLTCENVHCFLLYVNYGECVAVKSGFASGYRGEGARGLSNALLLLDRHGVKIDEYLVSEKTINNIDDSCLLISDSEKIESSRPVRPNRWYDYILDPEESGDIVNERLRYKFPVTIPYGIIDRRIVDLALDFEKHPDNSIISGFRRLEDIVRERAGLVGESGQKLFSRAFQIEDSKLYWENIEPAEQKGRASLFTAVYMAFRNPRAHKEPDAGVHEEMREFLLLNELFLLESQSVVRPENKDDMTE